MKLSATILCFFSLCLFLSCSEDDPLEVEEMVDTEGPELYDVRWIDDPWIENDPTGLIEDGGNYTISIKSGFQLNMRIRDNSNIESGTLYFLVNDDESVRADLVYEGTEFNYMEGSFGFVHRVNRISLGSGVFYDLQAGDKYYFYATFSDVLGNTSEMAWTADLIE